MAIYSNSLTMKDSTICLDFESAARVEAWKAKPTTILLSTTTIRKFPHTYFGFNPSVTKEEIREGFLTMRRRISG